MTKPDDKDLAHFANRLFSTHGFMLAEHYNGKHAVTITFPSLGEQQQFYSALVELSRYRTDK